MPASTTTVAGPTTETACTIWWSLPGKRCIKRTRQSRLTSTLERVPSQRRVLRRQDGALDFGGSTVVSGHRFRDAERCVLSRPLQEHAPSGAERATKPATQAW